MNEVEAFEKARTFFVSDTVSKHGQPPHLAYRSHSVYCESGHIKACGRIDLDDSTTRVYEYVFNHNAELLFQREKDVISFAL